MSDASSSPAVRRWLAERLNVRVGPHTAAYAERQILTGTAGFYVIGGDARTGRPVRTLVPPELLATAPRDPNAAANATATAPSNS